MDYNQQAPQQPYPYIGFMEAIQICFNKYACFQGRAGRAEYWYWVLFTVVVSALFSMLMGIFGDSILGKIFMVANWIVSLGLLIPGLAVAWRRMHDIGKGGGWYFINLIPLVGWIIWIVWCIQKGEPAPNRFGEPVA